MKINKIISTIIKLKEFPLKDLSSKISQTKNINISDILTSDNMTIDQILKLANALDYELILKPKATNSLLYHIPVTLDDDKSQCLTNTNIIDAFIKERCSYDISSTINYYALYNEFCLWCKNFAYIHKDVTEKVFRDVINTKFGIFKQNIIGICLKEGA